MLGPGDSAPNISGNDILSGNPFQLFPAHDDEVVCLAMVWYWSYNSTQLINRMESLWNKYQGHGVQMVAVQVDPYLENPGDPPGARAWVTGLAPTFPVVQDNNAQIYKSYGNTPPPYETQYYIIARGKVINYSLAGIEPETVIEGHILDAIYKRDPVDIEMVMDVSGTMNQIPPGASDTRLSMMKQAAKTVVDYLYDHGQTGDRMGLVWFSNDASEYDISGVKLFPIMSWRSNLKQQIDSLSGGGCTAMGAGLQTSFNTLDSDSPPTQKRAAILLTDGMQNVEPRLTQVGSHFEIRHTGSPYQCTAPSLVPNTGTDIATYNTMLHTIGVGIIGNYDLLLSDVADYLNGFYLGTYDPASDLTLIYFVDLCNCLAEGSPSIVHYHAGTFYPEECQVIERFQINSSVRKFTAILSWSEAMAGSLTFWIRAPDGSLLDLHQAMKLYDTYSMATIYLPQELNGKILPHIGEWEMIIRGETAGGVSSYRALIIAEDPEKRFTFTFPKKLYEVGDIVPLTIRLEEARKPVVRPSEIKLEIAALSVPLTELLADYKFTYPLREKMESVRWKTKPDPLEIKLEALSSDPRYQKQLQPIRKTYSLKDGTLDCKITEKDIILPVLLKQPGLNTFRITAHFDTKKNGPIQRVSMVSINVRPGKADPKSSIVKVVPISKKRIKGAWLHVTPRNAAGQLLGPGRGDQFKIYLGKEEVKCKIEDQLEGTYRFEVLPKKKLPPKGMAVRITLQDKPLWTGTIK